MTSILVSQGWVEESPGMWTPPTCYKSFPAEKALRIATHPDFRLILALMG